MLQGKLQAEITIENHKFLQFYTQEILDLINETKSEEDKTVLKDELSRIQEELRETKPTPCIVDPNYEIET